MITLKFEDGSVIDTNDVLEYEIQSNQLFDFDGVYGVFSNDFTLPFTAQLDELLGFVSLDIDSDKRYSKIPVTLIRNGSNFSEGYIIVNSFDEYEVNVTYFSNNSDWIESLKDLTTDQLNTRDISFNWSYTTIVNAWENDFNYNFPLINRGDLTGDMEFNNIQGVFLNYYILPIRFDKLTPCVKVNYLIEKAFKSLGYKVEGNYKEITNDLFLSSSYKMPNISEKSLIPQFEYKRFNNPNYSNSSFGVKFSTQDVFDYCDYRDIISTDRLKMTAMGQACAFRPFSLGMVKGTIEIRLKILPSFYFNLTSTQQVQLGQIYLERSNFSTIEFINQTQVYYYLNPEVIGGFIYASKKIDFEFQVNTITDFYFNLQPVIPLFNPTAFVQFAVTKFTLQKKEAVLTDGEIVFGDYFIPEVSVSDLLRELVCRYNCIVSTKNKIINITSLSNLDYSDSIDITDKVSNIISTDYSDLQGNLGQNSLFNVESDVEDYPNLGSGSLKINYPILEKEKEVFSSSFKSFEVTDSIRIPSTNLSFDTSQLRFKMAKFDEGARLLIAQRKNVKDIWRNQFNVKNSFWVETEDILQSIKVYSFSSLNQISQNPFFAWYCLKNPNVNLDFNKSLSFDESKDLMNGGRVKDNYSITAKNYSTVKNIFNKPQMLEVEVIINEELDLSKPYYLKQTGKYYLIQNQTVNSDSSLVTLKLIQI